MEGRNGRGYDESGGFGERVPFIGQSTGGKMTVKTAPEQSYIRRDDQQGEENAGPRQEMGTPEITASVDGINDDHNDKGPEGVLRWTTKGLGEDHDGKKYGEGQHSGGESGETPTKQKKAGNNLPDAGEGQRGFHYPDQN